MHGEVTLALRLARRVPLYALACALVALSTAITRQLQPTLGESISPLFFAAVMLSAWFGGLGPGLLSTGLAGWASAYYFPNNPRGSSIFFWDDFIRLLVFLMVALLISSLTSLRKRAQEGLRRSHLELEQRVERRTAELRESEERFRALVEGVSDYAIVMLDASGRVISWNGGAGRIEGYRPEEVVGQSVALFFPPEEVARGKPARQLAVAAAHGRHEDEGWRMRKDGSRFLANVITTALRDAAGRLRGFAQVTRDITELRNLEQEVLQIGESERRRIGHDVHDGLGQHLTGLALLSQNLANRLSEHSAAEAPEARRLVSITNQALEQARELAHGLAPVELGPGGLRAALLNLASLMNGAGGLTCRFSGGHDVHVSDAAAMHLYRIAQEAVNNAVRHGKASIVELSLEQTPDGARLQVADNGSGFREDAPRGNGIGVSVMKYRARMIGALLEIRSPATGGTVVSCVCARDGAMETTPDRLPEGAPYVQNNDACPDPRTSIAPRAGAGLDSGEREVAHPPRG